MNAVTSFDPEKKTSTAPALLYTPYVISNYFFQTALTKPAFFQFLDEA